MEDRLGNVSVFRTGADSVYAFFGGYYWNHGGNSLHGTDCFIDCFGDSHRNCPEAEVCRGLILQLQNIFSLINKLIVPYGFFDDF